MSHQSGKLLRDGCLCEGILEGYKSLQVEVSQSHIQDCMPNCMPDWMMFGIW